MMTMTKLTFDAERLDGPLRLVGFRPSRTFCLAFPGRVSAWRCRHQTDVSKKPLKSANPVTSAADHHMTEDPEG